MELLISFLSDWGYIALFICMALENMNIPIPSEIILGFAGFLVSQQIFSFWPTIIIGTAAGIAGSLLSYYIGLKGGREFMLRHTAKGGLGAKKLIAAKTGLKHMEVSLFYRPPSSGDPHFYLPSRRHRTLSSPPVYCLHDYRHNPVDDIPCIYRRNTRRKLDASS